MAQVDLDDRTAPGGNSSSDPGEPARLAAAAAAAATSNELNPDERHLHSRQECRAQCHPTPSISSGKTTKSQTNHKHQTQNSEAGRRWWCRARIHVALLGLAIAVVNCYAQATFCIAIVEMVLPADYVGPPTIELPTTSRNLSAVASATRSPSDPSQSSPADHSCPIEFKYRNYYDTWRFLHQNKDSYSPDARSANSSGQATGASTGRHSVDVSNRFAWDASQQGLLLGAFAVGTAPLQIIGGRLAEIYGSKWVLLMGCIGTGLTNLAIPPLARFSFMLLLVDRILMGVAQAGMEPGLMCLLADWLTPQEAGFFISMLLFAICLGFFLGSLGSSFILALDYGWPLTYYICGGLNLLVALVWYIYADSWPRASKYISLEELKFIEQEQARQRGQTTGATTDYQRQSYKMNDLMQPDDWRNCCASRAPTAGGETERNFNCNSNNNNHRQSISPNASRAKDPCARQRLPGSPPSPATLAEYPLRAPWLNILSSPPVWAFIICKISIRWCADVISNELPSYLANVLHLSIKINGLLNSFSSALFAVSSFLTGWLATSKLCMRCNNDQDGQPAAVHHPQDQEQGLNSNSDLTAGAVRSQRQNRSKTRLRKSFQSLASFGSAICLILMTRFDCDILVSMSCLLALSCFVVMGTGGELQIAYDMTSRYPGTLHGMACTLSVSGWLAPPLYGLILGDQPSSRSRWSIVWYSTAAINLFGGLVFLLFADASPRDFDQPPAGQKERLASGSKSHRNRQPAEQEAAYVNCGLQHGSSCESSPKSSHQQKQAQPQQPTDLSLACCEKLANPLEAAALNAIGFDSGRLVRCRQSESSFMRPAACYEFDSPLQMDSNSLILPYDEGPPGATRTVDAAAAREAHLQPPGSRDASPARPSPGRRPWWRLLKSGRPKRVGRRR